MNKTDLEFLDELLEEWHEAEEEAERERNKCEACDGEGYGVSSPGGWTRRCPKCGGSGVQV